MQSDQIFICFTCKRGPPVCKKYAKN